jgi:hypothetical protein
VEVPSAISSEPWCGWQSHGWAVRMLLQFRIHLIPWLRARREYVHRRSVARWIVQAPRLQSEDIGPPLRRDRQWAAAIWAKAAFSRLAGLTNDFVVTLVPANLNSGFRHHNDRRVTGTIRLLTVPTMAIHHDDWISIAFVTNGATSAAT